MRVSVGFGVGPFRVSQTLLSTGRRRPSRRRVAHVQPRQSRVRPVRARPDRRSAQADLATARTDYARTVEQCRQRIAEIEAEHEARWGHLSLAERPIYGMTTRQAWRHKLWFRVLILTVVGLWALGAAIAGPPSLLLMGPLWVWLFYRHQQASKATKQAAYDARFADVGTFDTEAAAREAEAFGLPSEVFRMTQTTTQPVPRAYRQLSI